MHPFLDPVESKKLVYAYLPCTDNERKDDVAKMFRMTAKSMFLEIYASDELKEYVKSKLKNNFYLKKRKN